MVHRLKVLLQLAEKICGRRGIVLYPALMDALYRTDIQLIPAATTFFLADNQAGFLKDAQVLHHRGSIQVRQVLPNVAGRQWRIP